MPAYVPRTNKRIGGAKYSGTSGLKKKARISSSKSINKIVRAEIERTLSKRIEVKHLTEVYDFNPIVVVNTTSQLMTDNYICPCPSAATNALDYSRGAASNQMIGNKIYLKKCTIDLAVSVNNYSLDTNPTPAPYIVRFWLYKNKVSPYSPPDYDTFGDPASANWFRVGDETQGMDGSALDLVKPVNAEAFELKSVFEMKVGNGTYTGTGNNSLAHYYANNDYQLTARRRIDITKYMPKEWHFDNEDGTAATQPVWLVWQCVRATGTSAGAGVKPVSVYAVVDFQYTDM